MTLEFEINYGNGFALKPPPRNWKGLVMHVIFTADQPNATLQGTDFEWTGINAQELGAYWDGGVTGASPGIYESPGLRIYGCEGSLRVKFLEGMIDLANDRTRRECDMIVAPTKESGRVDWLEDISSVITFSFLAQLPVGAPGRIVKATDTKLTPYVISEIPNYMQASLLAVSIFLTIREANDVTKEIQQCIQEIQGAAATATATLGLSIGLVIAAVAKVIIYVVYLTAIIIALVNMIKNLIENIIQLKKAKACMLARVLFQRGCEYFGLTFSSTILNDPNSPYYNDTWMPNKKVIPTNTNPLNVFRRPADESHNFPNNPEVYGHYDGNFRDFIKDYCDKYSAGITIIGNTLYFEEVHFFNNQSVFVIPNHGAPGNTFNYPAPFGTNASELPSNLLVLFSVDGTDLQTTHRYQGTSCSVTVQPNSVYNIKNLMHQTSKAYRLNCALAKRKEYLTNAELVLDVMINALFGFINIVITVINAVIAVINWIISIFGGPSTSIPPIPLLPTNVINNRIGWMEISNDSFNIPKTFIGIQSGTDWKISPTSQTVMSAENLVKNFHGKLLATRGNQQKKYPAKQFKFCCADFSALLNKNAATSPTGLPAKFKEFKWYFADETAKEVEYRVFEKFTNNLTEKIIIDGD